MGTCLFRFSTYSKVRMMRVANAIQYCFKADTYTLSNIKKKRKKCG